MKQYWEQSKLPVRPLVSRCADKHSSLFTLLPLTEGADLGVTLSVSLPPSDRTSKRNSLLATSKKLLISETDPKFNITS